MTVSAQVECPDHQDTGTAERVMDPTAEESIVKAERSECCQSECTCPCAQAAPFAPPTLAGSMSTGREYLSQHATPSARQRLTALFRPPA
jgi:hypothetical protein